MTGLCLLLLLAAPARPLLEVALVIPRPGDVVLTDETVIHDAQHGVTWLPHLSDETVERFFDGRAGRFVVAGRTTVGPEKSTVRLPLGEGELSYYALRDGRPGQRAVVDPSAVSVEATARPEGDGLRLELGFVALRLSEQQATELLGDRPVGEPVFAGRRVDVAWTLLYGEPLLVLLDTDLAAGRSEGTYRRRVGNQTIETSSPQVGVMLRLAPPESEPVWADIAPPIAPAGEVRLAGELARPGLIPFEPGLTAGAAAALAGLPERAGLRLRLSRLGEAGVEFYEFEGVPAPGGPADFPLRARDQLTVGRAGYQSPAADAAGGERFRGPQGPPGPAELAGSGEPTLPTRGGPLPGRPGTSAEIAPGESLTMPPQAMPILNRRLPLEEWRRVAPAAAEAAAATVAVVGTAERDGEARQVLMAGTIVSADGLVITAPAHALDGLGQIRVTLEDGRELIAREVARDATGALLALRVVAAGLPHITLRTEPPVLGQAVVVVGHPYGLDRSVSLALVGGTGRKVSGADGASLQLDLTLSGGNSGGPVVDFDGHLVAVAYGTAQPAEAGPPISLAVPASLIAAFIASLQP